MPLTVNFIGETAEEIAVISLARAMMEKLSEKSREGASGWETCSAVNLSNSLREHVEKGDPVDVANFCAFLFAKGTNIAKDCFPPVHVSYGCTRVKPLDQPVFQLSARIKQLVEVYGSLRAVASALDVDAGYLSRLSSGKKENPRYELLRKLGLRAVTFYVEASDRNG